MSQVDNLLNKTKKFGLLMAGHLEMGVQMSFLRTLFGSPISEGVSKKIRQDDMIFPVIDGGSGGFKLSTLNDYLEVTAECIPETIQRLEVSISLNQIPKTGEQLGCPAFPGLVAEISKFIAPDLKLIISNFAPKSE